MFRVLSESDTDRRVDLIRCLARFRIPSLTARSRPTRYLRADGPTRQQGGRIGPANPLGLSGRSGYPQADDVRSVGPVATPQAPTLCPVATRDHQSSPSTTTTTSAAPAHHVSRSLPTSSRCPPRFLLEAEARCDGDAGAAARAARPRRERRRRRRRREQGQGGAAAVVGREQARLAAPAAAVGRERGARRRGHRRRAGPGAGRAPPRRRVPPGRRRRPAPRRLLASLPREEAAEAAAGET